MSLGVAVILPVHNGSRFVAQAIESVLRQTRPADEIVVVDDGSTDDSARIVESFDEVRLVRQRHRGVGAARNRGLELTSSDAVAFLDQDDRFRSRKIELQAAALERRPQLEMVLAHQRTFLEPGCERPDWLRPDLLERPEPAYLPGTILVRRALFERLGVFDERRLIHSDTEWFLRARAADVATSVLDEVLLERRIHEANQSRDVEPNHRELLSVVREFLPRQSPEPGSEP